MSETVIPSSTAIERDATDVQTFEEAIDSMRNLQGDASNSIQRIKKEGEDLVITRYLQGVVVCKALDMDRSDHYGDAVVKTLAQRAGMHQSTLYRCKDFALAVPYPVNGRAEKELRKNVREWLENKSNEKGKSLNWSYCRNWAVKKLRGDKETKEKQLEDNKGDLLEKADKLEREADDLEQEAEEIRSQAESHNKANLDEAAEAEGVAYKAREVAEDLRQQAERIQLKGSGRIESEEYLDHVRGYKCLVCPSERVDAHHITTGGMGTKGHDLFTVPLCRQHHGELHQHGPLAFEEEHGVRLWHNVSYLLAEFITGADLKS